MQNKNERDPEQRREKIRAILKSLPFEPHLKLPTLESLLVACANRLTEIMRASMLELLTAQEKKGNVTPPAAAALKDWINIVRIENLSEWLGWMEDKKHTPSLALNGERREDWKNRKCYHLTGWKKVNINKLKERTFACNVEPMVYQGRFGYDKPPTSPTLPDGKDDPDVFNPDSVKHWMLAHEWGALEDCLFAKEKEKNWLAVLYAPWLQERAEQEQERLDKESKALSFGIRAKATTQGGQWTPIPRALDHAAAVFGGPVEVDGETYAPEPDIAARAVCPLRPRGFNLVPHEWLAGPAQLTLGLDLGEKAVEEYLIETATKTASLSLDNMCPKLLGFMFAAAPMTARPVKGTLLELARWLYPDWTTRRQNRRDLQGLGAAFVKIKGLRLLDEQPNGNKTVYDLFSAAYDLSAEPDASVMFQIDPLLAARMQGGKSWTGNQGGYFLMNMTRWLSLKINNPRLFPLALRLAAIWDKARQNGIFTPERLQYISADHLAAQCNTLSPGALMYLNGKKTDAGKTALNNARAKIESDLDTLGKAGWLGKWQPTKRKIYGKGIEFLPLPPDDYPEACKRAVKAIKGQHKKKA